MKLENKIAKLLEEHGLMEIMVQLIFQAGLPLVLLQISNRLCFRACGKDKKWLKRARLVHKIMEEIEKEEKLT